MLEIISVVWGLIEPLVGMATMAAAGATWLRIRREKSRRINGKGGGEAIVALQIGRPIAQAVAEHFGRPADELVVFDRALESDRDYRELAMAVYAAMCKHQSKRVHLVLSGPVGLNFLVGQLVGLHHFHVQVYQFDPSGGGYIPLPQPDRSWLRH